MLIRELLWPVFAMVGVIFAVWLILFVQRARLMRRDPPRADTFATGEGALRYFQPVEMPANNLRNLFEMPVLFFAVVTLLGMTANATAAQVALAWLFVLARAVHSILHLAGRVMPRFFAYLASCVVLAAMWIGLFVDMVSPQRF